MDHDANVNKAEYTTAVKVCQHASDVTLCVTNVDQHFNNNSGS